MTEQNPVDYLVQQFGMTRLDMTHKYGFGLNHLLLASQGRKDSLGPVLLSAFDIEAASHGESVDDLIQSKYGLVDLPTAWEKWRRDQRRTIQVPQIPSSPTDISPWARMVGRYGSVATTARTLRVRDLVVSRYMTTPTMPSALYDALADTGWGGIGVLNMHQRKFFNV